MLSPAITERLPGPGWRSLQVPSALAARATSISTWTDGRAIVISALEDATAPDGAGDTIPQWHVSVSELGRRPSPRVLRKALRAFRMEEAEEDNHHPGVARHFWLPVDKSRRVSCECKETEKVVREADGYTWTNPTDAPCRGCELQRLLGKRCPLHDVAPQAAALGGTS